MRVGLFLISTFLIMLIGCQSKQSCLQKYNFNSCEEFKEVYTKNKDKDDALKLHAIMIECGCKP